MNRKCPSRWTFFPSWERTKNVLRDTNEFNIDSLMGTKKCLLCFETHVFHSQELPVLSTRRWAIEISPVVKVVLLAMCFLVFALCLIGCNSRWDLFLSDNDSVLFGTCNQVQLSIYFSGVWPQSGFRLHSSFAESFRRTEVVFIVVLHTVMVQKVLFRNSPVGLPLNMMQLMHILSRFKQDTYS